MVCLDNSGAEIVAPPLCALSTNILARIVSYTIFHCFIITHLNFTSCTSIDVRYPPPQSMNTFLLTSLKPISTYIQTLFNLLLTSHSKPHSKSMMYHHNVIFFTSVHLLLHYLDILKSSYLNARELCSVTKVCKKLKAVSESRPLNVVWWKLCMQYVSRPYSFPPSYLFISF